MWHIILAVAAIAFTYFYFNVKRKMSFWRNRGFPEDPGFFPYGSQGSKDFMSRKIAISETTTSAYNNFPNERVVGTYEFMGKPSLVIRDLDLAKDILVKDFDQFSDRKPEGNNPYSPHTKNNRYLKRMLTELRGKEWKDTRSSLSPIFSSSKLKAMVPLIHNVADKCNDHLDGLCGQDIEGNDLMRRFAIDVISATCFGYEANSFADPNNTFKQTADLIVGRKITYKTILMIMLYMFWPRLLQYLDWPFMNKDATLFFSKLVLQSLDERRKTKIRRNDLLDIVLDVLEKGGKSETKGEDIDEQSPTQSIEELEEIMISNSLAFFVAGLHTVSLTASIVLYNLAMNPEYQEKLYQEIYRAVEENGGDEQLDYSAITGMEYMEMFFQESFRFYPLNHTERASKNDYKISGTELIIPKGIFVRIPILAIYKDKKY